MVIVCLLCIACILCISPGINRCCCIILLILNKKIIIIKTMMCTNKSFIINTAIFHLKIKNGHFYFMVI